MGKLVKYTGSKLLGEELRRLRGARGIEAIVELAKSNPLTSLIHGISLPGLWQIEQGVTMPRGDTLYVLSIVYNVSAGHLLNLIVQERLGRKTDLPATDAEARLAVVAELEKGNWYDALAIAIHGRDHFAKSEAERVLWDSYRALAMRKLGMRHDALVLLMECSANPFLAKEHRYHIHTHLVDVLAECGCFALAEAEVELAFETAPQDLSPANQARLLRRRVDLILKRCESDEGRNDEAGRTTLNLIDQARGLQPDAPAPVQARLDICAARAHAVLGNMLVAARDLQAIIARTAKWDDGIFEMFAWMNLGYVRRRQKRLADASACYERAETRAIDSRQSEELFEIYFNLYSIAAQLADGREAYFLKRCLKYWPFVQARTPDVIRFEQLMREGKLR